MPHKNAVLLCFVVILLAANFFIYREILAPRVLEVTALEVGKGDATLVQTSDKKTILIDTGPDASILRALGTALPPWQRTIDAVILTNAKKNFAGGLPDVLNRYKVSRQITLTRSQHITLGAGAYINIVITKNATTSVSISDGKTVTKIR